MKILRLSFLVLTALLTTFACGPATAAPDITVTDSYLPNNDLLVDFGSQVVSSTSIATVTVTNDGTTDLTLGNIYNSSLLTAPFDIPALNDNCSDQTLVATTACTFNVEFTPTAVQAYNTTVIIPSDDPDENPVNVSLTGAGLGAPDITVTDSDPPDNDLALDFGTVLQLDFSEHTITVTNDGGSDLNISGAYLVTWTDYDIWSDTCTEASLAPGNSCTVIVHFLPPSLASPTIYNDTLEISTDDPDESLVPVDLTGLGVPSIVEKPEIVVFDNSGTTNDRAIDFGNVVTGQTALHSINIVNKGTSGSVLDIYNIAVINPLSAPLRFTADACSGQSLTYNATCGMLVEFAPLTVNTFSQFFDIPNSDGDVSDDPVIFDVSGSGVILNDPPPVPRAIYPNDNSSGLPIILDLRWEAVTDPDGDLLTYELYYSTDSNLNSVSPIPVIVSTEPIDSDILCAGIGGASTLLLLACIPFMNRHRRELMIVVATIVLLSCGGASDDNASREGYTKVTVNLGDLGTFSNIRAAGSPAPEYVHHVVVKVTGLDMDPISATISAGILGELEVPNGPARLFEAFAFSQSGVEVHYAPTPPSVYLDGTPVALSISMAEHTTGSYPVPTLSPATTYYWKVVVSDRQTAPVESPVYSFTTQ